MKVWSKFQGDLRGDLDEFVEIVTLTLRKLRYNDITYSKEDDEITCFHRLNEIRGGDSWNYEFQAVINWTKQDAGINVVIKVTEHLNGKSSIKASDRRVQQIWDFLQQSANRRATTERKPVPWKANWATVKELKEIGFIKDTLTPHEIARSFILGSFEGHTLRVPERMTHKHVLVCGPTGSGKSTSVFIPNLIERVGSSALVTEAFSGTGKPILYTSSAGWRQQAGHQIIYFNPADLTSTRINPIDLVRNFDDAQHLANLIITNTTADTHMGDQIWGQSEQHLLQALILHVVGFREDIIQPSVMGDHANFGYIRRMVRRGPKGMEEELQNTRLPIARKEFEAYLKNSSPNFRYGVASGLMNRLNLFVNPIVAALTEVTDFDLDALPSQLFTTYLAMPVQRPDYASLAALIFNFFLTFILRNTTNLKYPMTLLLDEFTNFGYLPAMGRYLTVIRNAGIGAALGVQDLSQLKEVYRPTTAQIFFSQPGTKIFFGTTDDEFALRLSRLSGTATDRERVSPTGQLSNRMLAKPLIDAYEIMRLDKIDDMLVITGSADPIRVRKLKSWQTYAHATNREIPDRPPLKVSEELVADSRAAAGPAIWPEPVLSKAAPPTKATPSPEAPANASSDKSDNDESDFWQLNDDGENYWREN